MPQVLNVGNTCYLHRIFIKLHFKNKLIGFSVVTAPLTFFAKGGSSSNYINVNKESSSKIKMQL